ncbi:hypothetical protein PENSOL_c033G03287 [Penicillium solitum]|uniref:Integral membrane protein n=1 Tax=Penicillium solitum TaxID=60172 RepID=A0A1V6QW93_9EURO|nr:uncharacterized protein PENSOL_c033G03287 [Penicillium solitum]OQD93307.1 hypothetical protein PENSOL_c033G03287 [Penicillium solitum]
MSTPSPVPPGMSPPLTVDTETNHNGLITVIASFSLFLVLGSLGIRVHSAYSRRVRQLDDLTFAATVILALAQISVIFVQIYLGWGKSKLLMADEYWNSIEKASGCDQDTGLIPISAIHLHYMSQQVNSPDPTLEGSFATVVAEIHVALSVLVLTAPLMKPFIAAYVDENGLAYTDDASNSRTNHKITPHSDRSNETYPGSRKSNSPAKHRILKSIEISVDRDNVELLERR